MELVLVRHAEAARDAAGSEQADPRLSEAGVAQAERVAYYLAVEEFDAIYSSPLRRAMQTAVHIGESLGLSVVEVDGLAEFDREAPEYLHFDDLRTAGDPRYFACLAGDLSAWGTDIETFRARFMAAIDDIIDLHRAGKVVVVTHGGVLNGYLGGLIGAGQFFFHRPDNTGISRVVIESGHPRLVTLNECSHLRTVSAT
ncbi:probable phosphoglycerate mutase [Haloechinothrix alba]|uniref:Probable phosphoglycerate mutase n=1 Tax=Haloechinothrix alba TaxID=664784 RepID=A0A239A5R7_9PSEU|nr:histidine phosphatase family protein [Haloechinothrix alba]SNR90967.1 probable phosphoglycerate mutase [Haloechinothrix alba]